MYRKIGHRVYLAAPLFSGAEQEFNESLANAISPRFKVYLPQRDSGLMADICADSRTLHQEARQIFRRDVDGLRKSDFLIAILDGATVDAGVAFELGFAAAIGLPCIGLQTDSRRALPWGNNIMIEHSLEKIFHSRPALLAWMNSTPQFRSQANSQTEKAPLP